MAIRDDQVALTRKAIIDAVVQLSTVPDAGPVSVAEVSRRSGVSPATIYRHFPSRDALVAAAANDRFLASIARGTESWGLEDCRSHLSGLWAELSESMPLARQAALSEGGRELRKARFNAFRPYNERAAEAFGLDPASPETRRFIACMEVLMSVYAFLDLHDRQGLTPSESVDTVIAGLEALVRSMGIDPADFRIPLSDIRLQEDGNET